MVNRLGLIAWHRLCRSKPASPGHEVLSEDMTQAGITEIMVVGKETWEERGVRQDISLS